MNQLVTQSSFSLDTFIVNFASPKTRRAYKGDLECFVSFLEKYNRIQDFPLTLTVADFIAFRDWMAKGGMSEKTVARRMATVKSFMKWLVAEGLIISNPAGNVRVKAPNVKNPTEAFSDNEVSKILKIASNLQDQLILSLLFFLGIRRSELVSIKLTDIFEIENMTALRVYGKGNKVRELPLTPELQNLVTKYLEQYSPKDLLIPVGVDTVSRIIKRYAKKVGIKKRVSPHSCRATAITKALEQGSAITEVADMAGHSNISTTQIYWKRRNGLKSSPIHKLKY